jgi:hypothetical protein
MNDSFARREKAFEDKWANDQEMRFKVLARRNHLLGLWSAGQMGLTGAAADQYARTVVQLEIALHGDDAVVEKIEHDFKAAKIRRTEHLIRKRMGELLTVATAQVIDEG